MFTDDDVLQTAGRSQPAPMCAWPGRSPPPALTCQARPSCRHPAASLHNGSMRSRYRVVQADSPFARQSMPLPPTSARSRDTPELIRLSRTLWHERGFRARFSIAHCGFCGSYIVPLPPLLPSASAARIVTPPSVAAVADLAAAAAASAVCSAAAAFGRGGRKRLRRKFCA